MAEQFDIYDADGTHLGVKERSAVHRDGDWHRSFHLWLVNPTDRSVLLQQRAADKDTWPGFFDASVGGHLSAGEDYADALREIEEELGVEVAREQIAELGVVAIEQHPGEVLLDRELCLVTLALDDRPLEAYRFDRREISALAALGLDGLHAVASGETAPVRVFDGGRCRDATLSADALVPQPYLGGLADRCAQLLAGEMPSKIA